VIRLARPDDLARLQDIERAAGQAFRPIGMAAVAEDEPPTMAELRAFQSAGRAWVSVDAGDHPHAYLLAVPLTSSVHVEQVSVDPSHAGHRHGRALLDRAAAWGMAMGLRVVTLTTFADVPWNAPYYASLGFVVVPDAALDAELRAIREHEAAHGLDRWPRVVMRRGGQS
jgi:GNAT superfamily N-acetyltransferase